jgi:hypothetical protein
MERKDYTLRVRLTEMERAAAERLAKNEDLTLSTLVRRDLLQQARRQGIWPPLRSQVAEARLDAE